MSLEHRLEARVVCFLSFFRSPRNITLMSFRGAPATAGPRPSSSRPAQLRLSPPRGHSTPFESHTRISFFTLGPCPPSDQHQHLLRSPKQHILEQ